MKTVSIIIPVYNTIRPLQKCIESVVAQTYPQLEILIVNDGSNQETAAACDALAERDDRIRVIHKENGGTSSARNRAIDESTGDYISFIDSDDWVEPQFIEKLVENLIENNTDISQCNHFLEMEGRTYVNHAFFTFFGPTKEYYKQLLESHRLDVQMFVWRKLYKRKLFETVRFNEGQVIDDIDFGMKLLLQNGTTISAFNEPLYHYIHHPNSITTNSNFDDLLMKTVRWIQDSPLVHEPLVQKHLAILSFIPLYKHKKRMLLHWKKIRLVRSLEPDYHLFAPSRFRQTLLKRVPLIGAYVDYALYQTVSR